MASSEPSSSRLPEEDSSDMDSDSDNEVSQIDIGSQISTSIRSFKSAKKQLCVYRRQHAKTFPWATTSRKGFSFAFCMKCSHDINLGKGGTRDLRRHQETKLHKHSGRWCGCTASTVLLWANKRGVCNPCRSILRIFPWRILSCLSIGRSLYQLFKLMFPDSSIAKDFKCSCTKVTDVLKVIAQDCWKTISTAVRETKYFSLQTDETTDITVTQ